VRDVNNCITSRDFYIATNGRFVLFVDPAATGDQSGARWSNAFTDLQAALDTAAELAGPASETEVWVKEGIYYPDVQSSTNRNARIALRNRVYLMGGFDGTETSLSQRDISNNETILSGDIGVANDSTDNSFGMMTVRDDVTDHTVVDGWTIRGAFALSTASGNGAIAMIGDVGDLYVRNCTFLYNLSNQGACIAMREVSNTTAQLHVEYSFFAINGFETTSGYIGSAIHVKNQATVFNSFFIENKSGVGGVFYLNPVGADLTITNSTLHSNRTGNVGSVLFDASPGASTLTLQNSIVWDNFGPTTVSMPSTSTFSGNNNIYPGSLNGSNNINANPEFFDAGAFDLRIRHCSPAVDAGDNSFVPSDATVDLSGDPRVVNVVDMGAYENQITPIFLSASEIEAVSCNGGADGSISVNAGGGSGSPLEYSLDGSTYVAAGLFPNLSADTYTVFIRDTGDACVSTEEIVVSEPDALSLSTTVTNVGCQGDLTGSISGTVTGGSTPYQISFDGGTTFQTAQFASQFDITGLGVGNYDLTVVDGNGCTLLSSSPTTVSEPAVLSGTLTPTEVSCNGADDGIIIASPAGGTAPYQYSLDATNFQSQPAFQGLAPGAYDVTFQDANLCMITLSTTITEPTALSLSSDSVANVKCFMGADGFIAVAASGGTAPYTYSNQGSTFQTSSQWTNLTSGSYTILVEDGRGCEATTNVTVDEPDSLNVVVTVTDPSSCTVADGQLTVAVTGGTTPYNYQLDGGSLVSTNVFAGLDDGNYQLTVIDANNCTWSDPIELRDPVTSSVAVVPKGVSCLGEDDGSLTIDVSGGSTPITYSLDGGPMQSENVFGGLSSGTYTIAVNEANGCRQSIQGTVSSPDSLSFTTLLTPIQCAGDDTGQIVIQAVGGSVPYTYSSDGSTFVSTDTLSGLSAGQYTIAVQDANNCEVSEQVTLSEPGALTISLDTIINVSCFGAADGAVLTTASGGSGIISYRLDGSASQSSGQFGQLGPGAYAITANDENQCSVQLDVLIASPDSLQATTSFDGNTLTIVMTGGTAPYSYQLNDEDAQTDNVFENLVDGEYQIEVTDANGCPLSIVEQVVVLAVQPTSEIIVYPNPARDEIRILIADTEATVTLWDLEGRLIGNGKIINGQRRIPVHNIAAGVYQVQVKTRGRVEIIKVRITH
ncbi:MAG: T9SS type A sorting domain-containing protein, partial [Bacteroidota bacterium]